MTPPRVDTRMAHIPAKGHRSQNDNCDKIDTVT